MQTGEAAAAIGGPLLAGTVVSLIRFQGVVLIDALTFVAGMVTLALVKIPHQAVAVEARVSLWREAGTGFQYVRQQLDYSACSACTATFTSYSLWPAF